MPELREIGLDPAVQGVPLKKKLSVRKGNITLRQIGLEMYLGLDQDRLTHR